MNSFLKKYYLQIAFAIAGGIGGFLYWKLVGCSTGTCPIKSVWYWSTLWGVAAGYLTGDILDGMVKWIKNRRTKNE